MDGFIDTEVLVIGGGAAGMYAALEASNRGADVLLITKGLLGKSGCTIEAAYYMLPGKFKPPDNEETAFKEYYEDFSLFLGDQKLWKRIVKIGNDAVFELENMGIYWRRYSDGSLLVFPTYGQYRGLYAPDLGNTGMTIARTLRGEILRRNIKFLQETMATSLLTTGDKVVGATALNYLEGKFLVIRAKSVILATGTGGGYLWTYSTSTRELTGDGVSMAYRAGAEIVDPEMQFWHMAEIARPKTWCRNLYVYPFVIPPKMDRVHFVNTKGERFMKEYEIAPMWQQCRVVLEKGLGTKEGGYYASMKDIDPKNLEKYSFQYGFFKKLGIDTTKQLIEIHYTVHTMLGGIRVNERTETNIPGLYAAGGTAGLFCPTIFSALATGKIAAEYASTRALELGPPELDWEQIKREEERIKVFLDKANRTGLLPAQIKKKIREIMYDKVDYLKNEKKLKEALRRLQEVRKEMVPNMRLRSNTQNYNYDLVEALDIANMLDVAELIIHSSLLRKESRGPFQREDYPYRDDENWLKNIVMKLQNGKMQVHTIPVDLVYLKAGK